MIIMIGLAKKPKKGGKVEGAAAPKHLGKRARGGKADGGALDAREDSHEPAESGRDKVSQRSGTEERAVEMGDPRARGGSCDDDEDTSERKRGGGIHIRPSRKGLLHSELGVAPGRKIPTATLEKAKEGAGPAERKRIVFAENAKRWHH